MKTPQEAINQLKRSGFSDEEIIEAVLPMVRESYLAIRKYNPLRVPLFEDDETQLTSWAITDITTTTTSERTAQITMEVINVFDRMGEQEKINGSD